MDEGAEELAVDMRGERVHVDTFGREKLARIFGAVDARRLNFDLLEADGGELAAIVVFFECAGHAADPQEDALADLWRDFASGHHVSDTAKRPPGLSTRKASRSTRSLAAERLITQFEMMTSTVLSGSGMFSIWPFKNSTFSTPALRLFSLARASIPSVNIETVGLACGSDASGREQDVDPAARAEVEDGLARVELGKGRRIAAAERRLHRILGQQLGLRGVVQVVRDRIAAGRRRGRRATAGVAPSLLNEQCRRSVFFLHDLCDVFGASFGLLQLDVSIAGLHALRTRLLPWSLRQGNIEI